MSLLGQRFHSLMNFHPLLLFRLRLLTKHSFVSHFADWVEFSPYEIGMAKYGTFMSPDLFGSKFFMGTAVKKYNENPLHFLMGEYVPESDFKMKLISSLPGFFFFYHPPFIVSRFLFRRLGQCIFYIVQQSPWCLQFSK